MSTQVVKPVLSNGVQSTLFAITMTSLSFASGVLSMWVFGTMGLELPPTYSLKFMIIAMSTFMAMVWWFCTINYKDTEKKYLLRSLKIAVCGGTILPTIAILVVNLATYLSCTVDGFCS